MIENHCPATAAHDNTEADVEPSVTTYDSVLVALRSLRRRAAVSGDSSSRESRSSGVMAGVALRTSHWIVLSAARW